MTRDDVSEEIPLFPNTDYISDVILNNIKKAERDCNEKVEMFTKEERANFLKQFEESNSIVAKTYLHRDNGILFGNMSLTNNPKWTPDYEKLFNDSLHVLLETTKENLSLEASLNNLKSMQAHKVNPAKKVLKKIVCKFKK